MNKKYYIYQINLTILNIGSIILLIIFFLPCIYFYPNFLFELYNNYSITTFFISYFIYMIIHELLHSLAYIIYGAKFKNITYGICLEKGILCCLCKQNINKKNILHSLMYPLIFIGIIPYIFSLLAKLPLLLTLSLFNISGCIGDIIMYIFIKKLDNNIQFSEFDNPLCFSIYTSKNITSINHFGLKYINTTNNIERNNYQKLYISKPSIIFLIIFITLCYIFQYLT